MLLPAFLYSLLAGGVIARHVGQHAASEALQHRIRRMQSHCPYRRRNAHAFFLGRFTNTAETQTFGEALSVLAPGGGGNFPLGKTDFIIHF